MKKRDINNTIVCINLCQNTYDELTIVDSLLSAIEESCLNLELSSQYYENNENFILKLSEERNKYINLSAIARQRIKKIETLNMQLEDKLT